MNPLNEQDLVVPIPQEDTGFSFPITEEAAQPTLASVGSREDVDKRASRVHYALGKESPGKDRLVQSMGDSYLDASERSKQLALDKMKFEFDKQKRVDNFLKTQTPGSVDADTIKALYSITNDQVGNNPETFYEKKFASVVVNEVKKQSDDPKIMTAQEQATKPVQNLIAHRMFVKDIHDSLKEDIKGMGWGEWGLNLAGQMVPGLSWYRSQNAYSKEEGFFAGSNLQEQINSFLLEDLDTAGPKFKKAIAELKTSNPLMAKHLTEAFMSYTHSDATLASVTEAVGVGLEATPLGMTALAIQSLRKAGTKVTASVVNRANGNYTTANHVDTLIELKARAGSGTADLDMRSIPSILDPGQFSRGITNNNLNAAAVQRMAAEAEARATDLTNRVILNTNSINRLEDDALLVARQITVDDLTSRNVHLRDAIMDVSPANAPGTQKLTNVDTLSIAIGTKDANFFRSEAGATRQAIEDYGLTPKQFTIKKDPEGPGFYIEVLKDVIERDVRMADLGVTTTKGSAFGTWLKGLVSSADNQVSKELTEARKAYTYGAPKIASALRDNSQNLKAVKNDSQFISFMDHTHANEVRYASGKEMEDAWLKKFGSMPEEKHYLAYQDLQIINDIDYLERNLITRSSLIQQGVENHLLPHTTYTKEAVKELELRSQHQAGSIGKYYKEPKAPANDALVPANENVGGASLDISFSNIANEQGPSVKLAAANDAVPTKVDMSIQGVYRQEGPPLQAKTDFSIAIWDDKPQNIVTMRRNKFFGEKDKTVIDEAIANGYKTIETTPASRQKMKEAGLFKDGPVPEYIMVRELKSEPLPIELIPRREGGHRLYQEGSVFVSQPNVSRYSGAGYLDSVYHGDNNLFNFSNPAEASKWTERMETARKLMNSGDKKALQQYLQDNTPFQSVAEFEKMFKGKGATGIFDHDVPFMTRADGESSWGNLANKRSDDGATELFPNLRDGLSSEHNVYARDTYLKFSQERSDLLSSVSEATTANGKSLYTFENASILDPLSSLERTFDSVTKSVLLEDLKTKSAAEFIRNFQSVLDISKEELVRNPFKALYDPKWVANADPAMLAAAKNHRSATLRLMNVNTPETQQLYNQLYKAYAGVVPPGGKVQSMVDLSDKFLLGAIKDPVTFFRHAAYHLTQSMFNPDVFLTQIMQTVSIVGIANPASAAKGISAATVSRKLQLASDQSIIDYAAKNLKPFGWESEHFLEAHSAYMRSGFNKVDQSQLILDGSRASPIANSPVGKVIEASSVFYRSGEAVIRDTAWFASYDKWRKANPTAVFDNAAQLKVLDFADDLSGSMSKASAAAWNSGATSVPTQFLSYQFRLMDQLTGQKLDKWQKGGLLLSNMIAYGVPVGAFGAAGGTVWPWSKTISDQLRQRGIDTDANKVSQIAMDGVLSVIGEALTGTKFDVAGKFGPKGQELLYGMFYGDKNFTELMLGPGGGLLANVAKNGWQAGSSTIEGLVNREALYKKDLALRDLVDAMRYIKTFDKLEQLYVYNNLGAMISKSGIKVDITKDEAVAKFFTGMNSTRLSDFQDKAMSLKHVSDFKNKVEKEIREVYRDYFNALGNPGLQTELQNRIFTLQKIAGFDERERSQQASQAARSNGDTFFSLNNKYAKAFPGAAELVDKENVEVNKKLGN